MSGDQLATETPKRIQRQRTKGWRMPEGAVYVGRPSRWGNRWRVDDELGRDLLWDRAVVVELFQSDCKWWMNEDVNPNMAGIFRRWLEPLRGRDLACWCPLDQPCHADVLLELANEPTMRYIGLTPESLRGAADRLGEAMG